MHLDHLDSAQKVALGVSATQSALRTISATCRLDSAPAGSRPAVASVTFALHVTGDSQCADHVAVITTLHPVIPRQESVSTVSTTLMARTVKFAPLVTMVTPQVEHQMIVFDVSARVVAVETSLAKPVFWIAQLPPHLQSVTLVTWATLEINAKYAMTVTLATRSSQVAVVSRVFVITTPTHRTLATVTSSQGDASLACSIPLALAVSAANQVTMVML